MTLLSSKGISSIYGLTHCKNDTEYNALRARLLECSYVSGVSFTEDTNSMFDNLIVSLNSVVVLIIVSLRKKREDQPPASLGLSYFREER